MTPPTPHAQPGSAVPFSASLHAQPGSAVPFSASLHAQPVVVLTDRTQVRAGRDLGAVVAELAAGMARLTVVLREKDLARPARLALGSNLAPIVHAAGGRLLLAVDAAVDAGTDLVDLPGGTFDGLHLSAPRVSGSFDHRFGGRGRPSSGESAAGQIAGRSCHSVDEVRDAAGEGCDYVFLSPVLPTPSKPGYGPALGLDGLRAGIEELRNDGIDVPVVALGGITPEVADACLAAGAAGVAVMGSAMADPDTWVAWARTRAERAGPTGPTARNEEVPA